MQLIYLPISQLPYSPSNIYSHKSIQCLSRSVHYSYDSKWLYLNLEYRPFELKSVEMPNEMHTSMQAIKILSLSIRNAAAPNNQF